MAEGAFFLKTDGETVTFKESCTKVAQHFNRKVACNSGDEDYSGDYCVKLDIKAKTYWEAVCQLSEQSGYGMTTFFGGVLFGNEYAPITQSVFRDGLPIILTAPVGFDPIDGKEHWGFEIKHFFNQKNIQRQLKYSEAYILSEGKKMTLTAPSFFGDGCSFKTSFTIPNKLMGSKLDLNFQSEWMRTKGTKVYSLPLKKGAELEKDGMKLKLTDVSKKAGMVTVKYQMDWDAGLSLTEKMLAKRMNEDFLETKVLRPKFKKWFEGLSRRSDLKLLRQPKVKLQGDDGVESTGFNHYLGGVGVGYTGTYKCSLKSTYSKAVFIVDEVSLVTQEFSFKDVEFKRF